MLNFLNLVRMRFRKPNLKGPRFRPKRKNFISKELFDLFIQKFPQYKGKSMTEFKRIIVDHCTQVSIIIAETRDGVELPEGIGNIFLGGFRAPEVKVVDYHKSNQYEQMVMERNLNSDGLIAKIYYTNYNAKYRFAERQLWRFIACRTLKRDASSNFSENWNNYITADNLMRISDTFKKITYRNFKRAETKREMQDFNDFDI